MPSAQSARDDAAIDPVAIADEVVRSLIPRKCLRDLTCNLFGRGNDVRDVEAIHDLCNGFDVDRIVHAGGISGRSVERRDKTVPIAVNVTGTATIFEAARKHGVRRVVLCSSGSVYGGSDLDPVTEDSPVAWNHRLRGYWARFLIACSTHDYLGVQWRQFLTRSVHDRFQDPHLDPAR